jgi:hypothetical protein
VAAVEPKTRARCQNPRCGKAYMDSVNEITVGQFRYWKRCDHCGHMNEVTVTARTDVK